jgi:hypothetical protein
VVSSSKTCYVINCIYKVLKFGQKLGIPNEFEIIRVKHNITDTISVETIFFKIILLWFKK